MNTPSFPQQRLRRLRASGVLRQAVADVTLDAGDLIYPLFVSGTRRPKPVQSMPGVSQLPVPQAVKLIRAQTRRGLKQFLLFGVTPAGKKDATGSYASDPDCPVNRTLAEVRAAGLPVLLYADLCLCEYTGHGHCGVIHDPPPADTTVNVDNDATLELYAQVALAQARAGADVVAPSGMMDGQVGAIRRALDEAGRTDTAILAYSVKYASSLYGPFREAGEGGMKFGDRKGYQMDYRRRGEWRLELQADLAQGADMVMVKPALAYLDVLHQMKQLVPGVPVAAYHVSGEYAMLHAAARLGWLDLKAGVLETTYALRRAGADLIITYFAPQLAQWLG